MSVKVKICGITNAKDAREAVAAGADLLGLNFCPESPRCLTFAQATTVAREIPPHVVRVGIFVNAPEELVARATEACGLGLLQFHGDETPEYCRQFGIMSMKAFRVRDASSLKELGRYPTDAWLLDAWSPAARGGTGEKFNWDFAREAARFGKPIFLAGGLTPDNVAQAIRQAAPYAVDVSSGVEASPGKKDSAKVGAFIRAAKEALVPSH